MLVRTESRIGFDIVGPNITLGQFVGQVPEVIGFVAPDHGSVASAKCDDIMGQIGDGSSSRTAANPTWRR